MYKLETTTRFNKEYKNLSQKDREKTNEVIQKLLKGEKLEKKYKEHNLKGEFKDYKECHIKPDLLLVYRYKNSEFVLLCVRVGSHSKLFG